MDSLLQKESQTVEFKSSFNEEVIETLSAFANTKGGKVLVGVSNDGQPVKNFAIGEESVQKWLNEIKSKTSPAIIPNADIVEYKNSKILELSIQEFPVKPVACRGRYYKRVKNSNHQLSIQEISDIYMLSMQYSWDSYPYPKASADDINLEKVKKFITRVNLAERFQLPENPKNALIKLKMLQNNVPTNAAMILFSKENLLHNVHIGRFKTPSMIIADKMINGNLFDVVEESMQTIIGHLKFAFEITGQTTQRTEIPEYPLDAVRELLLNALIHRDYRSSTDIQIKVFDDKITFFNPGSLYGNITMRDLLTDTYRASTRNKQIAEAFYLTNDIEKYGSGFIRVRKAIENYPTMKFEFRESGDGFISEFSYTEQKISTKGDKIVLWRNSAKNWRNVTDGTDVTEKGGEKGGEKPTDNQLVILEFIEQNQYITIPELSDAVKIHRRKIEQNLAKLKSKGLIERIGPAKGGYWKINKERL